MTIRSLLLFAGALILSSGALVRGQLPGPEIPAGLGVNIHFMDPQPGELEMLAEGGFGMVRTGSSWAEMEREKGKYDFSVVDRHLDLLKKQGLRPLYLLCYGNPLYDAEFSASTPEARAAFARWAAAVVKRYAGRGIIWEIWNEPNYKTFWRPEPNVESYAKLAMETSKAIHEVAPNEVIIGPATSYIDLPFIETCLKAGVLQYWSGVSVHPYRQVALEAMPDMYRKLRLLIDRYAPPATAGKKIPIISSEWGFTTSWADVSAELQGKLLARQWLMNLSCDVPVSIWYDWRNDSPNPKDDESNFGTVEWTYHAGRNPVYDPKPAYVAAKALANTLRGYRFNKRLAMESPQDWVLLFTKGQEVKVVAWTAVAGAPRKVVIPTGPGKFGVVSHLGQPLPALQADAKGLPVELTDGPQYLTPESPNEYLNLLAAWTRFKTDEAIHAPTTFTPELTLRNTTSKPIRLYTWAENSLMLAPGESHGTGTAWGVLPVSYPIHVRQQLRVEGFPIAYQESVLTVGNPLTMTALPVMSGKLPVRIANPAGEVFDGKVMLTVGGSKEPVSQAEVKIAKGETQAIVMLALRDPQAAAGLKLTDEKGNTMLEIAPQVGRRVPFDLKQYQLIPDGDAKVKSEQSAQMAPALEGLPGAGEQAVRIDYHFDAGAKLLRLVGQEAVQSIAGKPLVMGIWVYSDNSGNAPRMRYVDATGQCFQVVTDHLHGTGWRYLTYPLDGTWADHWGGANDGKLHYPIRLDTIFLLDNASKKESKGTVYVAMPTLFWPAGQ